MACENMCTQVMRLEEVNYADELTGTTFKAIRTRLLMTTVKRNVLLLKLPMKFLLVLCTVVGIYYKQ